MKHPIWLDETGMEIKGPRLPASLMEAEHLEAALGFLTEAAACRVRWSADTLVVEYVRETPAFALWLKALGDVAQVEALKAKSVRFNSLVDLRVTTSSLLRDILNPPPPRKPRPPCLQRKVDILTYNVLDVCDAATFEEMTEASWGQGLARASSNGDIAPKSKTIFLAETEEVRSWHQGEVHTLIYGYPHPYTTLGWAAIQRNDDGEVTWVGRLVMVLGWTMEDALDVLYNHLDIKRILHAESGWVGSYFMPTGTSKRVNLLNHLEVTRAFGGIDLETPGSGSGILEMGIHSHGWNRIPGWKRLWEGQPGGMSVKGQGFRFR